MQNHILWENSVRHGLFSRQRRNHGRELNEIAKKFANWSGFRKHRTSERFTGLCCDLSTMESPDPNSPREEIDGEQNAPGGFVEGLKRFFITWKVEIVFWWEVNFAHLILDRRLLRTRDLLRASRLASTSPCILRLCWLSLLMHWVGIMREFGTWHLVHTVLFAPFSCRRILQISRTLVLDMPNNGQFYGKPDAQTICENCSIPRSQEAASYGMRL